MSEGQTLEQALCRLEEIAEMLERSDVSLEASLELYKEGVSLSVYCAEKLESTKQEVTILQKTAEGLLEKSFGNEKDHG